MIRRSFDEGIWNDGRKDDGRGHIIVCNLEPPNTLIRHCLEWYILYVMYAVLVFYSKSIRQTVFLR